MTDQTTETILPLLLGTSKNARALQRKIKKYILKIQKKYFFIGTIAACCRNSQRDGTHGAL
jgi:tellurite resistance protein